MNPSSLCRPSNNRRRSHRAQSRRRAYADCQRESAGGFHLNEDLNLALLCDYARRPEPSQETAVEGSWRRLERHSVVLALVLSGGHS